MDADSVSHMMYCQHLITDDGYEAITAAPNDNMMNVVILEYVRAMDLHTLFKFADLLKAVETQMSIGSCLEYCTYIYIVTYCMHINVNFRFLNQARAGLWLARAWFLKITSVQMYVCVCPPPRA